MVFRELSFSRLECGVHDRLHIYPLCGIFYFPWYRHQIEGTNGFYCLIRKTERFTISNVESQVFTPRIILAYPRDRTRAARVQSVRPTTGLTAPLWTKGAIVTGFSIIAHWCGGFIYNFALIHFKCSCVLPIPPSSPL